MNMEEIGTLCLGMVIGGALMQGVFYLLIRYERKKMEDYFNDKYDDFQK